MGLTGFNRARRSAEPEQQPEKMESDGVSQDGKNQGSTAGEGNQLKNVLANSKPKPKSKKKKRTSAKRSTGKK